MEIARGETLNKVWKSAHFLLLPFFFFGNDTCSVLLIWKTRNKAGFNNGKHLKFSFCFISSGMGWGC